MAKAARSGSRRRGSSKRVWRARLRELVGVQLDELLRKKT
jgi:hypothetical protein